VLGDLGALGGGGQARAGEARGVRRRRSMAAAAAQLWPGEGSAGREGERDGEME
jgi:hypothetical protein